MGRLTILTILITANAIIGTTPCIAQTEKEEVNYQRSSLYSLMVKRPARAYNKEIEFVFSHMEKPERFNDHSLNVKSVIFTSDNEDISESIIQFMKESKMGRRLVGKWFNRNKKDGSFDMELIKERGLYNATAAEWNAAMKQVRGSALLEDAGENLIGKTFVLVHDIRYIDRSTAWNNIKEIASMTTQFAAGLASILLVKADITGFGTKDQNLDDEYNWLYAPVLDKIKGFAVNVTSYLFQLDWNDDTASQFYTDYYMDKKNINPQRANLFKTQADKLFHVKYIGKVKNKSSKMVLSGVRTNEELIMKVCTRALDKNIADLQHEHAEFRIKAPLIATSPLCAYVGMKEDITESSKFEVLERETDKSGKIIYNRVGIIKPIKGSIWDNRYMADKEDTRESRLRATLFEKVSGGDFYPGMLIREIK